MKTISIDIESFSDIDLNSCGVYKYAQSSHFYIMLFGYSVDGGEVQVVDLMAGQEIPTEILEALTDESVTKWAYNAIFERVCLSEYLRRFKPKYFKGYGDPDDSTRKYISPKGWKCTMTWAAYMGLPLSLKNVGLALNLDDKKMEEGKDLIRYFCMPCSPTKTNGGRTRNLPAHAPDKWKVFKAYNKRDVEVEMAVQQRLRHFPVPEFVWEEYHLDQEINDRGIMLDMQLVNNAISFDEKVRAELTARMKEITEVENPNSVVQMREWLTANGIEMSSLSKKEVAAVLKTAPPEIAEVLRLRQQLSKSSVKKYQAMQNAVCCDGRARGMFQFYGANRSGRFCLAEGTQVLIKDKNNAIYEKNIEDVAIDDSVFDGENWVHHEGVVFSGEKDVITWDGITATPYHKVFIDASTTITLLEAKKRGLRIWRGYKSNIPSIE